MLNGGAHNLRVRSGGGPKMLRGIGAPGAPALGSNKDFVRRRPSTAGVGQRARNHAVDGGERIGLAQFAHGDVLRGPFADTGERAQFGDGLFEAGAAAENCRIGGDRPRAVVAWRNLFAAFDAALRLLHPFMPFLTEELWHQLPQPAGAKSIALDNYPEVRGAWKNSKALEDFGEIQEAIGALRTLRSDMKLDPKKKVAAEFSSENTGTHRVIGANRDGIVRLAALSDLNVSAERFARAGGMVRSTARFDVRLAYAADTVNAVEELPRLRKEIEGLEKAIASKEKQLSDATFRKRAPENIVRAMETTLAEQKTELEKLRKRLAGLDRAA